MNTATLQRPPPARIMPDDPHFPPLGSNLNDSDLHHAHPQAPYDPSVNTKASKGWLSLRSLPFPRPSKAVLTHAASNDPQRRTSRTSRASSTKVRPFSTLDGHIPR